MKITTALAVPCAVALAAMLWLPAAFSQDDIVQLRSAAFGAHKRPPAVFVHDAHNEKAGLEDSCATCHHVYEKGVLVPDDDSIGTPCADCHAVDAPQMPLRQAFHGQCKGCHETRAAGPVACGQCHPPGGM